MEVKPATPTVMGDYNVVKWRHEVLCPLRIHIGTGTQERLAYLKEMLAANCRACPEVHNLVAFVVTRPYIGTSREQELDELRVPSLDDCPEEHA